MNRLSWITVAACVIIAGCTTTDAIDPGQDQGLLTSIQGATGGYRTHARDQLRELDNATSDQSRLRSENNYLSAREGESSARIVALRSSVAALEERLASLQSRIASAKNASADTGGRLSEIEQRINTARAQTRRLDTDAQMSTQSEDVLVDTLATLQAQAADLEQLTEILGM